MASFTLLLLLAGYVLTVARLTRLITTDKLTAWWRNLIVSWFGAESLFTYLWFCRACMSIWVAFATAPTVVWVSHLSWWSILLLAPSASYLTVLLAKVEGHE